MVIPVVAANIPQNTNISYGVRLVISKYLHTIEFFVMLSPKIITRDILKHTIAIMKFLLEYFDSLNSP